MKLLALIVLAALAGCASSPAANVGPRSNSTAPAEAGAVGPLVAARFDATLSSNSVWLNGSLKAQDANRLPGAPFGSPAPASRVQLDLSKIVPKGVPVVLVGDATASMTQGGVRISFSVPQGEFRNNAGSRVRGGVQHVEAGIVHVSDKPVFLNLVYDEAEPAAEVPFTLSATVIVDPTIARAAFPVGLSLPEGARSFAVELVGEKRNFAFDLDVPNLMLWGPDDAFLGHHPLASRQTTIDLPANAKGGEYVLLLSQGGRAMRVLTPTNASLRAMPQTFFLSDEKTGATPQKAEWDSTYDRVPMLAGVQFSPTSASTTVRVKLESALGALFDDEAEGPWFNVPLPNDAGPTARFGWDGGFGIPQLAAGSYHATITFENAAGQEPIRARDFAAFWLR